MKNSADIHDKIDSAIATDTANKEHSKVPALWSDLEDNQNLDKTHVHKITQHLMNNSDQNWDYENRGNSTLEGVLSHPKTESKTINDYLTHPSSGTKPVDMSEEALNKPGVDPQHLTDFLSKKIEADSVHPAGVSSDVLRNLKQIAENKDQDTKNAYHGFIGQSYARGPRDQNDFTDFKPILDDVLNFSDNQTIQNLFDDHHDIPHNSIIDMYHKIDFGRRQKLLRSQDFNPMNHPNVDKDYIAAAALDPSHELNEKAIKSKNLPHHVIDRFIGDQNNEMVSKVMESENLAPEHIEKLSEYAINQPELHGTLDEMITTYSDALPEKTVNKLYSAFRGANLRSSATNLAESKNASDEIFMDSVNRGEHPSLYNRDVTPQLAETLHGNKYYSLNLLLDEKVPEEIKQKIVESDNVPFKDVSNRVSSLSYGVSKAYLKQMQSKNKINADLMKNIFYSDQATPEDKHSVLDMAVKGFKNKERTKQSVLFFGAGLKHGAEEVTEAFKKLKPEHQASVINEIAGQYHTDFGKINMTRSFAESLLNNSDITNQAKNKIMDNPSVDVETAFKMAGHTEDGYVQRSLADKFHKKLEDSDETARKKIFDKYSNESFGSLPVSAQAALMRSDGFDMSKINFDEQTIKKIPQLLGESEPEVVSKMTADQATSYFQDKDINNFQTHEWTKLAKSYPHLVYSALGKTNRELSSYMDDKTAEKVGEYVIPHILNKQEMYSNDPSNFAYLYDMSKDPDRNTMRQALIKFGDADGYLQTMLKGVSKKHPNPPDKYNPFDQETIDKLRDFAPGGANYNDNVWSRMVRGDLPHDLRYVAALTSPLVATRHIAKVHGDTDRENAIQEANKMISDERVNPETFAQLLEEKNVLSGLSDAQEHHSASVLNDVLNGFANGKVTKDSLGEVNSNAETAMRYTKDEAIKDKFVKSFINHIDASDFHPNIKDLYISKILNNSSVPESARMFAEDYIMNKAIKEGDMYRLMRLSPKGPGVLTDNPQAWSHKELNTNDQNRMLQFAELASDKLVNEDGTAANLQNWLIASKSMMNSINNMHPDDFHHNLGVALGKFISAGAMNPNTKDVANLMAKAWSAKMSTRGSRDNGVDSLIEQFLGNSLIEPAIHAFQGVQGPISLGLTEPKELNELAKHVTNAHQAAAIVENLGQDKQAKNLILKFKDMVHPDSHLGRNIAIKMTDYHPFMDQQEANSVINSLAEKDPQSFFDFMNVSRDGTVSSAKMVSVAALNLPVAVKNGMSKGVLPSNMLDAASQFCEKVNNRKNEIQGLMPEDATVAKNHLISNFIDSCSFMLDEFSSSDIQAVKEDAGDFYRSVYRRFDESFQANILNADQTDKIFAFAEKMQNDKTETSYKENALNSVHYVGFALGDIDYGKMSNILSKYPSSLFAAVGNKNFHADHVQYFKPKELFSALNDRPDKSQRDIEEINKCAFNFFNALTEKDPGTFNDEDKLKFRKKGFEYLSEHNKMLSDKKEWYGNWNKIENVAESIAKASETATLAEDCLNHIVANPTEESAVLMKYANMNADQTAIAIDHLDKSMDLLSGYRFLDLAGTLNLNKDSWNKIKEKQPDDQNLYYSALNNEKITDKSIKLSIVNDVVGMISDGKDVDENLIDSVLKVPDINRDQFDKLTSQMSQPGIFNENHWTSNGIYQNLEFGGDKFRDLGVTRQMENLFRELSGRDLVAKGPIKFHHGKDIDSFNTLLGMVPPLGLHWKDFKRANPKLAENPKIKNLFMSNKETVTPDIVTGAISKLPGSYHITFGKWKGIQRHSSNENLVVQFNLDKSFEDHIAQDPEMHQFFVDQMYTSSTGHPIAPRSIMWTRLDVTSPKGWIIEEIQSDFDSTLTSVLNGMSEKGSVTLNGREYSKEKLLKAQKYFKKLLDDHVEVAHAYIEKLAKQQGVYNLYLHGKEKRAELSSMETTQAVPKWLEYKYDIWPRNNGWHEIDANKYPMKTKGGKKQKAWLKRLS